jgi:ketosteroid isomerase-like protein
LALPDDGGHSPERRGRECLRLQLEQGGKEHRVGAKENVEVVRKGYEAFQKGDLAAFDDLLADNCVWHVPGRGQLAGDKKGRQATVDYYGQLGVLSEGTVKVDLHSVLGDDEHVVGLHRTSAQRGGKSFETTEAIVFHVRGGRIAEAWEHPYNLYEQDEVFS